MYGIEVRESGVGVLVELWGEWDLFSLGYLRETLNSVLGLRRPASVDLSGITFLDLESARELAVRSQLYAHNLTLRNPSPQVTASVEAFGLGGWVRFYSGTDAADDDATATTADRDADDRQYSKEDVIRKTIIVKPLPDSGGWS